MRAFLMLYANAYEGDDDLVPYKSGKSLSSERRAFTLLSSVCWYWHQTLIGWPESPTRHWVRHQLKKLIECEHTHYGRHFVPLIVAVYIVNMGKFMKTFQHYKF